MEFHGWLCFIFFSCILIEYLEAKTVSLNELLAAESATEQSEEKQPSKLTDREAEPTSSCTEILTAESKIRRLPKKLPLLTLPGLLTPSLLLKRLISDAKIKKRKLAHTISGLNKLSPVKLKKAFNIKSPLKPKKLKVGPRRKRKNQSRKREVDGNDVTHRYIPVLKRFSMLFDNILNSDSSDSYEIKPKPYKRNRFYNEQFEIPDDSSSKAGFRTSKFKSSEAATTLPSLVSAEVSSNTKSITPSKDYDHSTNRPNKGISILLSRNTTSCGRNNNGSSERCSTTCDGDSKGNITGDHGDHEHNTGSGRHEFYEESDENYTNDAARNDSRGTGYSRRSRLISRNSTSREIFSDNKSKSQNTNDDFGENQLETGGNKTESQVPVREPDRGLRCDVPQHKSSDERVISEPTQLKEICKESILSATKDSTSNKRIIDKDGPITTENEKIRKRNETVIVIERNSQSSNYSQGTGKKVPVLMIFDGYSVTRDKNGESKVTGKTIHVHS